MRKYYIVIPTKNRHSTLIHSIRTALEQPYDNLEIIISDNFSSQDTQDVVSSFSDSRLRYQRSDRPLAMVNSWEFALSAVQEPGYVHFMGDDNGLIPSAIKNVSELIDHTGASIVHGEVVQYKWPGLDGDAGELTMPLPRGALVINSRKALSSAYKLKLGFSRLPTINIAFVHTNIIAAVKKINGGRYFCASNPDVYSALLNSFCVDKFCYSKTPFVVNGASSFSNGGTTQKAKGESAFVKDNLSDNYSYHPSFPPSSSYHLNVYEAFAIAAEKFAIQNEQFNLSMSQVCSELIDKEYRAMNRFWLKSDIEDFAKRNNLQIKLPKVQSLGHIKPMPQKLPMDKIFQGDVAFYRGRKYFLENVYDASNFSQALLDQNAELSLYSLFANRLGRLKWKAREILMGAQYIN